MAEQEEQQQITVLDTPVPGPSQTERAVALARLLHHECTHLLQLYVSYQFTHSLCLPHYWSGGVTHSLSRYLWLALVRACFCTEAASYLSHLNYIFDFSCIHINTQQCVFSKGMLWCRV